MHVKLETLRVNLALGVQIYVLEAVEWPEIILMRCHVWTRRDGRTTRRVY